MREVVKNSLVTVLAMAATAVIAGSVARGQALSTEQPGLSGSPQVPTSAEMGMLGVGDRLKISFFETVDVPDAKSVDRDGADPQGTLRTFYQRMDLSGEYSVEADGALSIPLLGRFQVEGRPINNLRNDLATSFASTMMRTADINLTILERSPVYVVGPVKKPGAYKYVPGMVVLHAVALAGGFDQGEHNISAVIESVRELAHLQGATDKVRRLQARRARLVAQRDGLPTLPVPVQLAKLGDEPSVRTFLATETALLQAEQAQQQQRENEIAQRLAAARTELGALKGKLSQIDVQKDMRIERLNGILALKDRGVLRNNDVILIRTELSDIEARRQDYVVAVVQAEGRLAQAEEAKARMRSEDAENLTKSIATADQEIEEAQQTMTSAGLVAAILQGPNGGCSQAQTYEILRRSKDGTKPLQAAETSPLMPGDILKIGVDASCAAAGTPQSARMVGVQRTSDDGG
jgi:polysaccharide biosynthesis/export protein ExoF